MDFTILYVIGISLGVISVGALIRFILNKYDISLVDLIMGIDIFNIALVFIKLCLKEAGISEEYIDKYAKLIIDSLQYIVSLPDEVPKQEKIDEGVKYAIELCDVFDLDVSLDRKVIIEDIFTAAYNLIEAFKAKKQ